METIECARALMQNIKVDRVSALPDELLIHVLSFLSTKEAVQTCILSKRWRRIWANLPILKFNTNEFEVDDLIGNSDEALRKSIARFYQFVNGVVKKLKSTQLDRVCYAHDTKQTYFYDVPMRWLDRVALLKPQVIDISISKAMYFKLPHSLFSCATLQHLKIKLHEVNETTVIPAAAIKLPSLKVQLERGFLNCRNLNNLKELVICMWAMSFDFNLVASLLKLSPNITKLTLLLDVSQAAIQEEHRQEVLGDVLFQHKFVETVEIRDLCMRKLPQVFVLTLMKTLNTYLKEIGNVIIE